MKKWTLPNYDKNKMKRKKLACIACKEEFDSPAQLEYHTVTKHQKPML